jgi:hypothetical protein
MPIGTSAARISIRHPGCLTDGFSRSLRGMTLKACDRPAPFWVDLLTSQYIAAGDAGETQRR